MSFSNDLRKISKEIKKDLDSFYRSLCLSAGNSLIYLSPVKTGRFRNNWNFTLGKDDNSTNQGLDKSGTIALGRIRAKTRISKIGDVMYMSNNLPYAYRLETGWSEQRSADEGIVKKTARLFDDFIKDALKDKK